MRPTGLGPYGMKKAACCRLTVAGLLLLSLGSAQCRPAPGPSAESHERGAAEPARAGTTEQLRSTSRPAATLSGTLRAGAAPLRRVQVVLRRVGSDKERTTLTDDQGRYQVSSDSTGSHLLIVRALPRFTSTLRTVNLREGGQEYSPVLPDTKVTVRVHRPKGRPKNESVQLHLYGPSSETFGERAGIVTAKDPDAFDLVGMEYGEYRLSGSTGDGFSSGSAITFRLATDRPAAEVDLRFERLRGRLSTVDESGRTVSGTHVSVHSRTLPETTPGTFELSGVSVGDHLIAVAPGRAAVCHVVQRGDFPSVALTLPAATGAGEVVYDAQVPLPPGEIVGLPGSTCAVPLSEIRHERSSRSPLAFRFFDLPEGRYSIRGSPEGRLIDLNVPGPPAFLDTSECVACPQQSASPRRSF